jgi:hypothetical protein
MLGLLAVHHVQNFSLVPIRIPVLPCFVGCTATVY